MGGIHSILHEIAQLKLAVTKVAARLMVHRKLFDMKVNLLKEGKEIPPDLAEKIQSGKDKTKEETEKADQINAEVTTLRDKVKHQEGLLQRCKEIIKSNKERYATLSEDKQSVDKELEDCKKELERAKVSRLWVIHRSRYR